MDITSIPRPRRGRNSRLLFFSIFPGFCLRKAPLGRLYPAAQGRFFKGNAIMCRHIIERCGDPATRQYGTYSAPFQAVAQFRASGAGGSKCGHPPLAGVRGQCPRRRVNGFIRRVFEPYRISAMA